MERQHTCMIIDDELEAIDYLASLVADHCPQLKIVTTATDSTSAIKKYHYHQPDLIFMDIQVDEMNGFEIFREIYREKLKPNIIFITAFEQYGYEAFKVNALDYLLKPVDPEDLIKAVSKFTGQKDKDMQSEKILEFINGHSKKVRFNNRTGYLLLDPGDIIYCEADRNYTRLYTSPEKYETVSLNLAIVEEKLPEGTFWRISRSLLVNSVYVKEVDRKQKNCTLEWKNNKIKLPASSEMLKNL